MFCISYESLFDPNIPFDSENRRNDDLGTDHYLEQLYLLNKPAGFRGYICKITFLSTFAHVRKRTTGDEGKKIAE